MGKQALLNVHVDNISMTEAVLNIEDLIKQGKKSYVVAVNTDVVIKAENDNYLKTIINEAEMVLVDGQPLVWVAKLLKCPVKAKISGSDLVPELCRKAADKGYTIFIIGGKEGVAKQAQKKLEEQYQGINVVGTYSPPLGFEKDEQELNQINRLVNQAHPDILIVCFGCPKQEKWIYENYLKYNAAVSICAGATVDFMAENIKRAPKWMREWGLEWFYRFLKEPRRMFKRYFVDDTKILGLIWKYK